MTGGADCAPQALRLSKREDEMLVRLLKSDGDDHFGDYEFEALPREGESIRLTTSDGTAHYRVVRVEHRSGDPSKPAVLGIYLQLVPPAGTVN